MNRILLNCLLAATSLAFVSISLAAEKADISKAKQPNIIYFLVDDLGYVDLSCLGSDIQTPNIDSIAKSGVRCTQAYATGCVCGPSRAGLLTGRYQHRFGFEDNPGPFRRSPGIEVGLDLNERTMANRLKSLGYATGMIGKWHDGDANKYQPPARGFDEFYGFNNGAQRYLDVDSSATPMMRGTEPEKHGEGYLTDTFGKEAVAFVERHRDEPFFLYVSLNAPHGPLTASEEYLKKYASIEDENRRIYAAMVDAIDVNVGRVLDKLRECGIEENTLVVFMSDHGGVASNHGRWADNGILRAGKGTLWEGGLRTQLFLQWKAVLPQDAYYTAPVIALDLLPTMVAAAGGKIDPKWKLDGVNLLPYLQGQLNVRPHAILHWRQNEMWAIRDGDWKLLKDRGPATPELYNLATDPSEKQNVAQQNPEKVAQLKAKQDAWDETVERPRFGWWPGIGEKVEAIGARPNIVFIFSDDHALRTIGDYGSGLNKTPNLDRIASEGALFTRSYCTNSICCPSRASILTGKHSHKNGVPRNGSAWNSNQFVFARALRQAGYKTAVIGKWHIRGWPTDEFDHWKLLSGAGGQGHYYNPEFQRMDGSTEKLVGYSTDIITDQSIAWMKQQKESGQPFLMMCQFKAPHIHRVPPARHMDKYEGIDLPEPPTLFDDYKGRTAYAERCWMRLFGMDEHILNIVPHSGQYDMNEHKFQFLGRMTEAQRAAFHKAYDPDNDEYRRLCAGGKLEGRAMDRYKYQRFLKDYLRCVAAIDDNVGRILDWLEAEGLADNTVVVYSSDQGFFTGEHGWNDKRWMYEESLSMPLMMRWPGRIPSGIKIRSMVQNIDYAPTFLDMAGVPIPEEVQGRSLLPLFEGKVPSNWRDAIYYHYYMDGAYNLPRFEGVRTERYKLINYYHPEQDWELFDLQEDPREMKSVYGNPVYSDIQKQMKTKLQQLREQYDLPPLGTPVE